MRSLSVTFTGASHVNVRIDMNPFAPATQSILPAVAAIIFDKRGQVLLQKRRDVEQWGLIGGHVEFGETVEQAIYREIQEETALTIRIDKLIGVYSDPASQTYHYAHQSVQYITTYFRGRLLDDFKDVFANEETIQLGLFSVDALPAALAQLNAHWLTDALNLTSEAFVR
ncbi:NUDIX domain-containing protein [Fibrella aestuarina]|uniref:NUDIX domain-containing protein n=2 Tax=Fibrivirga algicola TaxID=2950420 RepID=A0ABX0QB58_9BACT|nr:NUDIX domain-containing protein [Fibrivirga algicola]